MIHWLNGIWTPSDKNVADYVSKLHVMMDQIHCKGVRPIRDHDDIAEHLLREGNVAADLLCKRPTGTMTMHLPFFAAMYQFNNFVLRFDGSKIKQTGFCSCAFIIYGSHATARNTADMTPILIGSWQLPPTCIAIDAELAGCCKGLRAMHAMATSTLRTFMWETHVPNTVYRPLYIDH